jgi:VWFA-related protein
VAASAGAGVPIEPPQVNGRVYVALLDDLHIDPHRAGQTANAARQFIDQKLAANDLMATVFASGWEGGRQPFTNNRDSLRAAVERLAGRGLVPVALTNGRDHAADERIRVAVTTMRTIQDVAAALGNIAGRRKSILFFSEGVDFDYTNLRQYPNALEVIEATQEAVAAATRANVTVYAIDPRGTTQLGDDSVQIGSLPRRESAATALLDEQRDALQRSQDNLRAVADQTGGFAVINQNRLSGPFDRIIEENSSYYLLGYNVPLERQDGKFHKIEVRMNRRDLKVRARSGYVITRKH